MADATTVTHPPAGGDDDSRLHPTLPTGQPLDPETDLPIERRRATDGRNAHSQPVNIVNRMAPDPASGGLRGPWATMANLSAVVFVMGLAYLMYRDMSAAEKENRQMFRDEMRLQREADSRGREGTNAEIRALSAEIRSAVQAMQATERSVRSAVGGVRPPQPDGPEPAPMPTTFPPAKKDQDP